MKLKAPFPYFGGKATVADIVWVALGQPAHYIEPFFGSGAVLLNRPMWRPKMVETVNDKDGFIANVWRAIQFSPDETAKWCDWPVNHADLIARKARLIREENYLLENLCRDDKWHDAELAGYWIWAASCWIGSGLTCPGKMPHVSDAGMGVHAVGQMPHVGHAGRGVHAVGPRPHVSHAGRPHLGQGWGQGSGVHGKPDGIYGWFADLSHRLRRVRVVCGDWQRVCGGNWQVAQGICGMFFDPPYSAEANRAEVYDKDDFAVAHDVRRWAIERGKSPEYRIVLAGYYEEHAEECLAAGWSHQMWKAQGGYGNLGDGQGAKNRHRECLFFSPHCIKTQLF